MHKIYFRFYEELNDFLPEPKKKKRFEHLFIDRASVKDMVEALGVPHTEIDLILVNGKSVNFNYIINDGDDISIYPVFESLDISNVQHLRPKPLREPRFVVDEHLGKLAKYLRMFGFNTYYKNHYDSDELVEISLNDKRAILTKNKNVLKRSEVTHAYFVRSFDVENQVREIIKRFDLQKEINEFSRCMECNGLLQPVKKETIINQIPPKVANWLDTFFKCSKCNKIYWQGTHHQKMNSFIQSIKKIEL
ncbi:MAG: Mut7-C ubiquitin/RNAse domain-containing protein [Ignavibacterium sp.]|nr:MAG: Mut7-C ubiquitin/RNAse domain-containing protein [Ignavibacterium sp.]